MLETRLTRAGIARHRGSGAWAAVTLGELVAAHARRDPARVSVVDGQGSYTYAQVVDLANRVARGLLALGVRAGDVVAVQLPNWRQFAGAFLGVERIGATVNPLTTILREHELHQMLALGGATTLVVPDRFRGFDHARSAVELADHLPALRHVVVVGGDVPAGAVGWDELLETRAAEVPPGVLDFVAARPTDVAELAFTSGTTGEPKGVMHTHESAVGAVASTIERHRFGPADVFHVVNSVGHNAGYFYGVRLALQSGGALVLQDRWDPDLMVELVREHRATFAAGATTHLVDLLGSRSATPEALRSLRMYICAGADVPRTVARAGLELLPRSLTRVFGMTEIGHTTSTDAASPREKVIETDGSPQPEMEVRVVDEAGEPVATGDEGHIHVRGPFVFAGYVQGRDFTDQWFTGEWFHTGDLGRLDKDGYLAVTGRAKDIIVRGGEKVPVREMEELLVAHPKVAEVAVVPVADARLGERAVACLRLGDGGPMDLTEVSAYLAAARVTKQFWPEEVRVVEDFPRTPSGKIQKAALRRRLESGREEVEDA